MAFLKGLFEKKQCSICGGDIGLLGNRKLEDGNCCKNCAAKLSPWFSDRRSSTVEEIKAQIDMREQNKELVKAFNTTRTMGRSTKVYVDENAGKFMVTPAGSPPEVWFAISAQTPVYAALSGKHVGDAIFVGGQHQTIKEIF